MTERRNTFPPRKNKPPGKQVVHAKRMAMVDHFFMNGFNKKQAMISAGYTRYVAERYAKPMFDDPTVKAEIDRRMKVAADKADVSLEWWVRSMKALAESGDTLNPYKKKQPNGTLRWDFTDATPEALALINKIRTDYKTVGKGDEAEVVEVCEVAVTEPIEALNALGRYLGAFNDKLDVNHSVGVTDRLMAGRERVKKLNAPE